MAISTFLLFFARLIARLGPRSGADQGRRRRRGIGQVIGALNGGDGYDYVYSDPARDPRHHTLSAVYVATADGEPVADDDAAAAHAVSLEALLDRAWAFDHQRIATDYLTWRRTGQLPAPR